MVIHKPAVIQFISTHTLARRVTLYLQHAESGRHISTHTLARRVTHHVTAAAVGDVISTHTLARRVTSVELYCTPIQPFQPTPSHGG